MIEKRFLWEFCQKEKPLAEVHVLSRAGVDVQHLIDVLNALGPDVAASANAYNSLIRAGRLPGHRLSADMDATKEALDRLFGWKLRRALSPGFQLLPSEAIDTVECGFYWEELGPI